ncbi:MAG: M48 family metallopeptidase [Anaerolineales bacterium]|nr:M48 family metallopeptidase [Anaerolineales bacterium]
MATQIEVGGFSVDVIFKDIKNVHLSVHPPTGRVRISAPNRMKLDTIRVYAISKLDWIKRHQVKMQSQERETPREYLDRESHYVWGKRYLLKVIESDQVPTVELKHTQMLLIVRPGSGVEKRESIVSAWYREEVRKAAEPLIAKWEKQLGVSSAWCYVQRMKTKWGSCNPSTHSIRLNSDLAKKPRECLEYIVVHELIHLLEPSHNARFTSLMDKFMPNWKHIREELNRSPLSHVEWGY